MTQQLQELEQGFWGAAGDGDYTALISSVYTRHHGEWKLSLHQQTPIDGG